MRTINYYDAVVWNGAVYCILCLTKATGHTSGDPGVLPIFATDEWQHPPQCDRCGKVHTYMQVLDPQCIGCGNYIEHTAIVVVSDELAKAGKAVCKKCLDRLCWPVIGVDGREYDIDIVSDIVKVFEVKE